MVFIAAVVTVRTNVLIVFVLLLCRLQYLAKRYLKKQQVRDFLRVVATNRSNYELRYLNLVNDEAEA